MEITLEKINERSDPYQLFLDSIKNKDTARRYKNSLHTFLKLIPDQIYQETLGKTPENRERDTLGKFFVDLARKSPELASTHTSAFLEFHLNSLYLRGSGCPFPRSENNTIANVIATPIAAPYAAIPASAMKQLTQNQQ